MIINESPYGINETMGRLLKVLVEHEMTIFAIVDHSGGAAQVGLSMPNTKLVIFGNPKGGTAFMLADANFSIDLPLKIVVRKNNSKTELVYQTMEEVASRYQVTGLSNSIKKMDEGILALVNQVINK
ncbi:MAG: DUF302 domain-containing protein [Methanobacterium sp.]|jgi:uncharacterized protein (DUF302 family)